MQLITAPTPQLVMGFDVFAPVSGATAKAAAAAGYAFAIRYVDNLGSTEIADILGAGLALMLVKEAPASSGYTPTQGTEDGRAAASLARGLAIPEGMIIFVDVENVGTSVSQAEGYIRSWYAAVAEAGYVPGIYVGTTMFSASELHERFGFQHYWRAGAPADLPFVDQRGYQLYQHGSTTIDGHTVDVDYAYTDLLGGKLLWLSS